MSAETRNVMALGEDLHRLPASEQTLNDAYAIIAQALKDLAVAVEGIERRLDKLEEK